MIYIRLSSKKINTTIQDSYGLTWIATEEGLKYVRWKIVHNFESILADKRLLLIIQLKILSS